MVGNIYMRGTEFETNRLLCSRFPVRTSVIYNIPSSKLVTTRNCTGTSNVPFDANFIGGGCVNEAMNSNGSGGGELLEAELATLGTGIGNGEIIVVSSSVIENRASGRVIHLVHRTKTTRIRVLVDSPPFMYPYCFNISVRSGRDLVTGGLAADRVYRCVNTSSLNCLDVGDLEGVTRNTGVRFYSNYFANDCSTRVPEAVFMSGCTGGVGEG